MDIGQDGLFIVFEGIDGAGTSTQIERFAARLRAQKRAVHVTREPSTGPIGSLIRLVLTERLSFASARHAETMALLFAADRLDHLEAEVAPLLRDGWVVLSDRYDLSSIVYQSIANDGPPLSARGGQITERGGVPWIREVNRFARRPDVTLIIDVASEVAAHRRRMRGGPREIFDDFDLQTRLAARYRTADELVPKDRVVHVNGDGSAEEVEEAVALALTPFLGAR